MKLIQRSKLLSHQGVKNYLEQKVSKNLCPIALEEHVQRKIPGISSLKHREVIQDGQAAPGLIK